MENEKAGRFTGNQKRWLTITAILILALGVLLVAFMQSFATEQATSYTILPSAERQSPESEEPRINDTGYQATQKKPG